MNSINFILVKLIILTGLTLTINCNKVEEPEVVSVSPHHQAVRDRDMKVVIVFSDEMDVNKTEGAIRLATSESSVDGKFKWKDGNRRVQFIPELPLTNGEYYTITIDKGAIDTDDNCIPTEHTSSFFVGEDLVPPVVSDITPENGAPVFPLDESIVITFSEPMDRMSVERGVRFTPPIDGQYEWDDSGSVATFIPNERTDTTPLDFNTSYKITVSTECLDVAGNAMIHRVESFFTAGDEFDPPVIDGILETSSGNDFIANGNFYEYHGVEQDAGFVFSFNEPIDRESFRESVSIKSTNQNNSADVEKTFIWINDLTCQVLLLDELTSGETYKLVAEGGIKDIVGNAMGDDFLVYFVVDGTGSTEPDIDSIFALRGDNTWEPLITNTITDMGSEYSSEYDLEITFSRDIEHSTVPDNLQITAVCGEQPGISGQIKRYEWTEPTMPDRVLSVTLSSIEGGNLYKFTLKGGDLGIKGKNGIPIVKDYIYYFYFSAN